MALPLHGRMKFELSGGGSARFQDLLTALVGMGGAPLASELLLCSPFRN